jgi:hypothetical protein
LGALLTVHITIVQLNAGLPVRHIWLGLNVAARYVRTGQVPPRQTSRGEHGWDRLIINQLVYLIYRRTGIGVGVVRASFREADDQPIFGDSGLYAGAHVQIAVRDRNLIEERWLARGEV